MLHLSCERGIYLYPYFLIVKLFNIFIAFAFSAISIHAQTDTTTVAKEKVIGILAKPDSVPSNKIPIFSVSGDDLDSDRGGQDIAGLLQSSRDLYASTAGFHFGAARFRIRGYNNENLTVMINGVRLNDVESGLATFANWGGLNDITRIQELRPYLNSSRYNFAGVGGYSQIEARAGLMRKGSTVSYASSNRTFRHRLMFTHSTGMNKKGWAFTVSASRRWAEEGYVEGTSFDAWSYLASIEKKINERHSFSLLGFGAPIRQGRQGFAVQESYDLAGTNFYNPNWGYQNGEKRNARISNNHRPTTMLTHHWKFSSKTKITSSIFYLFGRNSFTNLNWYDAADPRPDYYRYLPSFYRQTDPNRANEIENNWRNDVNTRQLNWDQFYFANSKNLYLLQEPNGVAGTSLIGNRSKYIVEENRIDNSTGGFNMNLNSQVNDRLFLSGGFNATFHRSRNYRVMNDLLGGDFWLDLDQFAERDFNDNTIAQNDLNNRNNVIKEGDVFGFDYDIHNRRYEAFIQADYSIAKFDIYASTFASSTSFWREGNMLNGRFPDNSFGKSPVQSFFNTGGKLGITYKITGRHFVYVNGAAFSRAPITRDAYLSPRTRDDVVEGLQNEQVLSYDVNYQIRYPKFKMKLSYFYTEFNNQIFFRNFYHDEFRNFINYTMSGLNTLHEGVELSTEFPVWKDFTLQIVATRGNYIYNSRPTAKVVRDNSAEVLAENRTIYLQNYRIGGMPQTAICVGTRYNNAKGWWGGLYVNYFDDIYLEPNPDRRTEEALGKFVESDPQWSEMLEQTKLAPAFTVDFSLGKSWRIKDNFMSISANVNNALNNQSFIVSGFEQLRYDPDDLGRFPPRLVYSLGAIYNIVLNYRF